MTDKRDGSTLADELTKLTELRNSGAITQSEFEIAKQRILGVSGMGTAQTLPGRAAPPEAPIPDPAPPPTAVIAEAPVGLGALPATEVLPDVPAGGFTLGGLHGEDDVPPAPKPDPPLPPTGGPSPPPAVRDDPPDLGVADLLGDDPAQEGFFPSEPPGGAASLRVAALPSVSADEKPLELARPHPLASPAPGEASGVPSPGPAPPAAPPPDMPPAVTPGYMYADSVADHQSIKDLGGSVPRTAWMIGGGVLALVCLLLLLSAGFRVWIGGALFVLGALLVIGGSIWLLVEAARTSVLWLVLYLFVPFANLAFVIVHWSTAKRPFFTHLVGAGMLVMGAMLFVSGTSGASQKCASKGTRNSRGGGSFKRPVPRRPKDDGLRFYPRRRAVRWRAAGGFSCAALQDRVDDCEEEWVNQLEEQLKRRGIRASSMRLSVDRPQVAVKQAQTLVFESGEQHRCQAASKRGLPMESEWLSAVQRCFSHKQCKSFSACHTGVFLRYVGQLPFSCRFYCNKELFQCGAEVAKSGLGELRGYKMVGDEDRLDKLRPKLYVKCLRFCKKNVKTYKTREAVLQCMFQPTCKGFVSCVKPLPLDP